MSTFRWFLAIALLVVAVAARAQDVTSGPNKGDKVGALKVFDATGNNKDKDVDYAADRKDKPTVYVFVQADKFSRPIGRFLKELDKAVKKESDDAYIVAVWLTDDAEKTKEYLPRAQQSIKLETTALTCHTGDKAGPKGWGINGDAHVTAVVAHKGKVVGSYGYQSINETDVPGVTGALKKALEKK